MICWFSSGYVLRRPEVFAPTFWEFAGWHMKKQIVSTTSCGANSKDAEYGTWSASQAATQWGPTKYVQW